MKAKQIAALSAALIASAVASSAGTQMVASASRAPMYLNGVAFAGAVLAEESPVEMEREELVFSLPDFPQAQYESEEEFARYASRISANYTLYNPTGEDIALRLFFPFGSPDYAFHYGSVAGEYVKYENISAYQITADGEQVGHTVRYTCGSSMRYSETAVRQPSDGYREDAFFSPGLSVTEYRYRVSLSSGSEDALLRLTYEMNAGKTRLLCPNLWGRQIENGKTAVELSPENGGVFPKDGDTAVVYVLGRDRTPSALEAVVYGDLEKKIEADVSLLSSRTLTLGELIEDARLKDGEISQTDWYNIAVDRMNAQNGEEGVLDVELRSLTDYGVMRWWEYELNVPAGGRVVNGITAPIYPTADEWRSKGTRYRYQCLLSPAQEWADFKRLDVRIVTEFPLKRASFEFAETEDGYAYSCNYLPSGELSFEIYDGEETSESGMSELAVAFIILAVVVALGLLVAAILISRGERKRRRNQERAKKG